jgi:hypothetical protein
MTHISITAGLSRQRPRSAFGGTSARGIGMESGLPPTRSRSSGNGAEESRKVITASFGKGSVCA